MVGVDTMVKFAKSLCDTCTHMVIGKKLMYCTDRCRCEECEMYMQIMNNLVVVECDHYENFKESIK